MGLQKGVTNNPNGRPQGSKNKVGQELRERIKDFLDGKFDEVVETWTTLEPKDKVVLYEKLLSYSLPKLQSVKEDDGKDLVVNWNMTYTYDSKEEAEEAEREHNERDNGKRASDYPTT